MTPVDGLDPGFLGRETSTRVEVVHEGRHGLRLIRRECHCGWLWWEAKAHGLPKIDSREGLGVIRVSDRKGSLVFLEGLPSFHMYIYICIYLYIYTCVYIYIYI